MIPVKRVAFSSMAGFTAKQLEAEAMSDQFKYFLYGGAKGGGKSRWLRWRLLRLLMRAAAKGFKNVKAGLFCEDYPTLMDRQASKIEAEFPRWLGRLGSDQVNGYSFKLNPQYGGGVIQLRNLDDPSKYDSVEYAFIGVDELTKNTQRTFTQLRTILRWAGMDEVRFIAGTNPGGIGHEWVKKQFVDKQYEAHETEKEQFAFLQALCTDNPFNSKVYIEQLNSIPDERLRRAYRDGDWDVFEGQYFGEWDRNIHVIKYYKPQGEKYLCMDYGWTAPAAVYWVGKTVDRQRVHYNELHETKLTPVALADAIVDRTDGEDVRQIIGMYCDPACWASKAGEDSVAAVIEKRFAERRFPVKLFKANNDRVSGAWKMREMLKPYKDSDGKLTAKLLFTENCLNAIRTIPSLTFSKRNAEDWDTAGDDHDADAVRYGLTCEMEPPTRMSEVFNMVKERKQLQTVGAYW